MNYEESGNMIDLISAKQLAFFDFTEEYHYNRSTLNRGTDPWFGFDRGIYYEKKSSIDNVLIHRDKFFNHR